MRKLTLLFISIILVKLSTAQELNARVTVVSNRIGNNVSQNAFRTLQKALNDFVSTHKWTSDNFSPEERIQCSFLLNLEPGSNLNEYNA